MSIEQLSLAAYPQAPSIMKYILPLLLSVLFLTLIPACEMIEKATPGPRAGRAEATGFPINVSPVMRGTVASETIILGYQPVVARGYGLVVGFEGDGIEGYSPDAPRLYAGGSGPEGGGESAESVG